MKLLISMICVAFFWTACIEQASEPEPETDDLGGVDGAGGVGGTIDATIDGSGGTPIRFDAQVDRDGAGGVVVDAYIPPDCSTWPDAISCQENSCFWWRAAGESARCHTQDRPRDCDQPDGPTCEAAGCEWTGAGCAPSLETACALLDPAACGARPDCEVLDMACVARADATCSELAEADCRSRFDCGWFGVACAALDQGPCADQGRWACQERRDCDEIRIEGCDVQKDQAGAPAQAPDAGIGGGGGAGGVGGVGGDQPPGCLTSDDCGNEGLGCYEGNCLGCDTYVGCTPIE